LAAVTETLLAQMGDWPLSRFAQVRPARTLMREIAEAMYSAVWGDDFEERQREEAALLLEGAKEPQSFEAFVAEIADTIQNDFEELAALIPSADPGIQLSINRNPYPNSMVDNDAEMRGKFSPLAIPPTLHAGASALARDALAMKHPYGNTELPLRMIQRYEPCLKLALSGSPQTTRWLIAHERSHASMPDFLIPFDPQTHPRFAALATAAREANGSFFDDDGFMQMTSYADTAPVTLEIGALDAAAYTDAALEQKRHEGGPWTNNAGGMATAGTNFLCEGLADWRARKAVSFAGRSYPWCERFVRRFFGGEYPTELLASPDQIERLIGLAGERFSAPDKDLFVRWLTESGSSDLYEETFPGHPRYVKANERARLWLGKLKKR
jgi:hypothetical protein